MSARAWVLFLSFSTLVTGAAWAVAPLSVPADGAPRIMHARVSVDLETNSCRLLSVDAR